MRVAGAHVGMTYSSKGRGEEHAATVGCVVVVHRPLARVDRRFGETPSKAATRTDHSQAPIDAWAKQGLRYRRGDAMLRSTPITGAHHASRSPHTARLGLARFRS